MTNDEARRNDEARSQNDEPECLGSQFDISHSCFVIPSCLGVSGFGFLHRGISSFVIPAAGSGTLFPCNQNSDLGEQFGSYSHHGGPHRCYYQSLSIPYGSS